MTTYAIYARDGKAGRYEVMATRTTDWSAAINRWDGLEAARRSRLLANEWVTCFEVRQTDDPAYADAPVTFIVAKASTVHQALFTADGQRWRRSPHFLPRWDLPVPAGHNVPYVAECLLCGRVISMSGFGVGAHRRVCNEYERRP